MDNKILEKAREEKLGNEYENSIAVKSGLVDTLAVIVVVLFLVLFEYHIKGTLNWALMAVGSTIICADCLYMGIRNRKIWRIIIGILACLFAIAMIIAYINQLVAI